MSKATDIVKAPAEAERRRAGIALPLQEEPFVPAIPDAQSLLEMPDPAQLIKEGFETELFVKIEEGAQLRGTFLGAGGEVEVPDPQHPGAMKPLGTWLVKHPAGPTLRFNGSSNLDAQLRNVPVGWDVVIIRAGQVKSSRGMNVTTYIVMKRAPATAQIPEKASA